MSRIRVGVAGWDYPDWAGIVYPRRASRAYDRLRFLAGIVDVIEINSTFYRPVAPERAGAWVGRTADLRDFAFTAKAHRSWTHDPDVAPADAVGQTLAGLAPLREAGRLRAVLVQFPQSFHRDRDALSRIEALAARAAGWPLVLEVRHRSWAADGLDDWLRERGIGWCVVDQPRMGRAVLEPLERVTSPVAYLRLHGRNRSDWFRAGAGRDARYDYFYDPSEIAPLAEMARRMSESAEEVVVIQNNHFRGQAVANALQFAHALGRTLPALPQRLADAYPALESMAPVRKEKLF